MFEQKAVPCFRQKHQGAALAFVDGGTGSTQPARSRRSVVHMAFSSHDLSLRGTPH